MYYINIVRFSRLLKKLKKISCINESLPSSIIDNKISDKRFYYIFETLEGAKSFIIEAFKKRIYDVPKEMKKHQHKIEDLNANIEEKICEVEKLNGL